MLCESLSVDQETNRVSLFNVLEDLHLVKLPKEGDSKSLFVLNQFVAVAVFNREPEDKKSGIRGMRSPKRINRTFSRLLWVGIA